MGRKPKNLQTDRAALQRGEGSREEEEWVETSRKKGSTLQENT